MTVTRQQLDSLLAKHPTIDKAELDKLANKSPNGATRKGIGGNITRENIEFRKLEVTHPDWIGRDIEVMTMDGGGIKESHGELSNVTGVMKLMFVGSSGDPVELHRRRVRKRDPYLLTTNSIDAVSEWTHAFFQRTLWGVPDNNTGKKLFQLVGKLKTCVIPSRKHQCAPYTSKFRYAPAVIYNNDAFQPTGKNDYGSAKKRTLPCAESGRRYLYGGRTTLKPHGITNDFG